MKSPVDHRPLLMLLLASVLVNCGVYKLGSDAASEMATTIRVDGYARNPIVSHIYTADPSAKVFGDRVYVYASHDEDDQRAWSMLDYHVFSSVDLVNWQDHGVVLEAAKLGWGLFSALVR